MIVIKELEIEYAHYLCQYALTVNNLLSSLYHHDSKEQLSCYHSEVENEHDVFLLELIEASKSLDEEIIKLNDYYVQNYHRLDDLIRYMHSIDYLTKINHYLFENNNLSNSKLCNYQLEDSYLMSFEIDSINHTCNITLINVLFYGYKTLNKAFDVSSSTIIIKFLGIKSIEKKGNIDSATPNINKVYKWYMMETNNNLNDFGMFVIVGHRKFLLNVKCLKIEIQTL